MTLYNWNALEILMMVFSRHSTRRRIILSHAGKISMDLLRRVMQLAFYSNHFMQDGFRRGNEKITSLIETIGMKMNFY